MKLSLTVNGETRSVEVAPLARLIDVLRDQLGLTGTKEGCGEGECGSCTVLLDDEPVNACLVPIGQCDGRTVLTIEGLEQQGCLSELGRAFVDRGAIQCGFCTPGLLVSTHALLRRDAAPSEQSIREAIAGNLCRCTGYQRIVEAVQAVVHAKGQGRGSQ
jgi:aerobic carbon-monoxide dehydrogenase small subunit